MRPLHVSLAGYNVTTMPGWLVAGIFVGIILWLWSVVVIAREKTADPYDRIVWLLIVLMLNIVGTLLYFFFADDPSAKTRSEAELADSEAELKRRANDGSLK